MRAIPSPPTFEMVSPRNTQASNTEKKGVNRRIVVARTTPASATDLNMVSRPQTMASRPDRANQPTAANILDLPSAAGTSPEATALRLQSARHDDREENAVISGSVVCGFGNRDICHGEEKRRSKGESVANQDRTTQAAQTTLSIAANCTDCKTLPRWSASSAIKAMSEATEGNSNAIVRWDEQRH